MSDLFTTALVSFYTMLLKAICNSFFTALVVVLTLFIGQVCGQSQNLGNVSRMQTNSKGQPMGPNAMKGGDSLQRRDKNEDSITIYFRMFDSSRVKFLDSSLNDYTVRFPLPADYLFLSNTGAAARSVLFSPRHQPGYDPGLHGFDIYQYAVANTRFFNTTRPYTELDYLLGAKAEQIIKILHTQNIRPLWNASFEYRLINAPGSFKNLASNHSSMRFSSSFSTKNRRYSGYFIYFSNKSKVNENGGIRSDTFMTSSNQAFFERFNIPTWLGGDEVFNTNFFNSSLTTGNEYRTKTLYIRHQYDLGQKDSSFAKDSSVIRIFYPRLRLQHNVQYQIRSFAYTDLKSEDATIRSDYTTRYGFSIVDPPLYLQDSWKELTNEVSIILFPQKNNQEQFFKAGAGYQLLEGTFGVANTYFNGTYLLGEYRNRTRNRKWDLNGFAKLFTTGAYAGDYTGSLTLQTNLGQKLGVLKLGFQNTNRTPSFIFDTRSSFIINGNPSFDKENLTTLSGELFISALKLKVGVQYHLLTNFTWWNGFVSAQQDATLQNVLHLSAEKKFSLTKHWSLYADVHIQQSSSSAINVPLIYTRNRLAYEGNFYKNLFLSAGFELRYFSNFTADTWNPFNGQWVVQSNEKLKNLPDFAAFFHFRIRSFRMFIRAENLNTIDVSKGFNWLNNNYAAPLYPTPSFQTRLGVFWTFVN